MAEKTILVCDTCSKPAAETVTIKTTRGNFVKDLCSSHVNELTAGARKPRRGRPRTVAAGGAARKKTAAKKTTAKKTATTAPKRRGRPRKKPA
jgi:topoisomerase IA-like protein